MPEVSVLGRPVFTTHVILVSDIAVPMRESALFIFGNIATTSSAILEDKAPLVLQICSQTLVDPNIQVCVRHRARCWMLGSNTLVATWNLLLYDSRLLR